MKTKPKVLIAAVAMFAVVGGATAAGLAYADPTPPAPTPSSTPTGQAQPTQPDTKQPGTKKDGTKQTRKKNAKKALLGRALHGEATLPGGKKNAGSTRVVVFQRGTVAKVSTTAVEVKSADGYTATYAVGPQVRVRTGARGAKQQGAIGDVRSGGVVRLLATKDGQTLSAKRIVVVP